MVKAKLVRYDKGYDEDGNIIEIKMWEVGVTPDKPHGYKYSLVYIVRGKRVIGYDNAERKGDTIDITETGKNHTGLRA